LLTLDWQALLRHEALVALGDCNGLPGVVGHADLAHSQGSARVADWGPAGIGGLVACAGPVGSGHASGAPVQSLDSAALADPANTLYLSESVDPVACARSAESVMAFLVAARSDHVCRCARRSSLRKVQALEPLRALPQ
jgi:hypothetical protein